MANPNIVNVTQIFGNTDYLIPGTTAATTWTALTPATGTVNKLGSVTVSNVGVTPLAVTLSVNSAVAGGGTAYRIAFGVTVPVAATLILVDKSASLYIGEGQSVVVQTSVASSAEFVASYEAIT
jgi:hypothetical protein